MPRKEQAPRTGARDAVKPHSKRLAVPSEDHPVGYAGFEGTIPPGEYGARAVIVRDTGIYDNLTTDRSGRPVDVADAAERGHVTVNLHGEKLRGGYSLTRMRRGGQERWLLVKTADEFASAGNEPADERPESVKSRKTIGEIAPGRNR